MSIVDQKNKIFGNIAAARVLSEGLPDLFKNSSFPSINNNADSVAFLTDLLKALVGLEKLRDVVVDTLVFKLDEVEVDIKTEIKKSLKTLVNCGTDPSIPAFLKSTGAGVTTEVDKVDFFDMLKTDPTSKQGGFLYIPNDYNTFLYDTVQADGPTGTWDASTTNILDVNFSSVNTSPTPNNTLTFKTNVAFDNKTLTEFNNTYVDSLDLFDIKNLLNKLIDALFGSISLQLNKTRSQLRKEEEIKTIIECIINSDESDVIDDSFFTFTNADVAAQEEAADFRKKGIRIVETCGNAVTSISPDTIDVVNNAILSATTGEEKKQAMSANISTIGSELGSQAPDSKDSYALELNFIEGLIKNLVSAIVGFILSPKIITIFLINYKIVYGVNQDYDDAADFMRQNKNLVKDISKAVRNTIIKVILTVVLKEIAILVALTYIEIKTEKSRNELAQILSLVGAPQEVIRLIRGL